MKRIISLFLCVAMLVSMVTMAVGAIGEDIDKVTTENVMSFTTDKESYAPGDTVSISVAMDSIWGDPELKGDIAGFDNDVRPGAYGMASLSSTIVFDTNVFTAQAHEYNYTDGGILNADNPDAAKNAHNKNNANSYGCYSITIYSTFENEDGDGYAYFNGEGSLWTYNLTIKEDVAPGTYYIPVGPYSVTTANTPGKKAVIKFTNNDKYYFAWAPDVNSFTQKMSTTYVTNYSGDVSLVDTTDEVTGSYGTQYECAYIAIKVEGDTPIDPPIPPVVDPMSCELVLDNSSYTVGNTVTAALNVKNNEGITSTDASVNFDNTVLKLIEISSPVENVGSVRVNYDSANALGSFDARDVLAVANAYFTNEVNYEEDGTILTAKFEVLTTAEDGETPITVENADAGLKATANATINAGGHKHNFEDRTIEAACKTQGSNNKTCSCGLDYVISVIPAKNHVLSTTNIASTPATCTTEGITVTYCDVCGERAKTDTFPALGHDIKTIKNELSCTTNEETYDICQREGCNYKTEAVITKNALGHKDENGNFMWGEPYISTKPTTNSEGAWGKKCSLCGEVWEYEPIPVLAVKHGDVDMDGEINIKDVVTLLKYIAKWDNIYFSKENADVIIEVDSNKKPLGRINTADVTRILQYIAGWDVILGETRVSATG